MKVEFLDTFVEKLKDQIDFISLDKPQAARNFKKEILQKAKKLSKFPYRNRKSIYFDNDHIRDLIFKGFVIIYKVDKEKKIVSVFALIKHENK
jgi:plasmid stabilization system protein ParE